MFDSLRPHRLQHARPQASLSITNSWSLLRLMSIESMMPSTQTHVHWVGDAIQPSHPLPEKAMGTHSSTLAWKIRWTEEPGRLQSMGSLRVRHNWATSLSLSLSCIGEGNGNPLQCSCLENPRDGGAWWAAVYGITQSRTRLKRLSSSSIQDQFCLLF